MVHHENIITSIVQRECVKRHSSRWDTCFHLITICLSRQMAPKRRRGSILMMFGSKFGAGWIMAGMIKFRPEMEAMHPSRATGIWCTPDSVPFLSICQSQGLHQDRSMLGLAQLPLSAHILMRARHFQPAPPSR